MDVTSIEFIQKLLVDCVDDRGEFLHKKFVNLILGSYTEELQNLPWAFCVHASVIDDFLKVWHNFVTITEWKIHEFTLQIGTKCFDMRIIYVTLVSDGDYDTLRQLIKWSQFSFPWQDKPTLFISSKSFKDLQYFIRTHNLTEAILKIEETPGITMNDELIKVVTFNDSVTGLKIFEKYEDHLKTAVTPHRQSYFMTLAFPWLQAYWLQHFHIQLDDHIYPIVLIILNHLASLNYIGALNIFDLISTRLALCDIRNPLPSTIIKYEIDFMIRRELRKIVKNNHLDLDEYAIEKNNTQVGPLTSYFVYEFQNYFKTVNSHSQYFSSPGLEARTSRSTLKLAHEDDIFIKLNHKSNVEFTIDGSNCGHMSLSLFLDLIEYKNVNIIRLDTDHRWLQNECELTRSISNQYLSLAVHLNGQNTYNFIEDFVSSLQTVTLLTGTIRLYINCDVNDYTIFNNLQVNEIELCNTHIDGRTLAELNKCKLKSVISFFNSTFENTPNNWALLNSFAELKWAEIREDEGTWQSLFEFIFDEMVSANTKEFQFDDKHIVVISDDRRIFLYEIKFTMDELGSKIEIRDKDSNQIVDLYNLKHILATDDDTSKYEFYQ